MFMSTIIQICFLRLALIFNVRRSYFRPLIGLYRALRELCAKVLSPSMNLLLRVKSLNLNKCPGPDGLTLEFYLQFWDLLGPLLVPAFNECFRDSHLCDSMTTSLTRLIFKKTDDVRDLKNWRQISLINVDYKICSKAITLRLSKVLASTVSPDQTCSFPRRSILSNVTLLRDVLDYIDRTGKTGILISLDQEKAFDRVDHSFLLSLLERFGFGPDFINWVKTLCRC